MNFQLQQQQKKYNRTNQTLCVVSYQRQAQNQLMQKKGASDSDPRGSRDFQNLHYFFKSINLQNKQKFFN